MVPLEDIFDPKYNQALKQLIEEHPDIKHSLLEEAAIANRANRVIENVEVKLTDISDKSRLLKILQEIQSEYSNEYAIYGKRINHKGATELVVQLTVKEPSKLLGLAKKDYVDCIRKANPLPERTYLHMNDIPKERGLDIFIQLEKNIKTDN